MFSQKRGQVELSIRYVVFAIIIILVLVTGYAGIKNIMDKGERTDLLLLKNQMQKDINSMNGRYGDVKTVRYALPSKFNKICFVDLKHVDTPYIANQVIHDSVVSGITDNIFLLGEDAIETMSVENIELSSEPFYSCTDVENGVFEIKIRGIGNAAVIKAPILESFCQNAASSEQPEQICRMLSEFIWPGYAEDCCSKFGACCSVS